MARKKKTSTPIKLNTYEDIPEEYLEYNGHRPIQLFPYLYNIKPCINQSHPVYHPDSVDYERYWTNEERKCIEGLWFEDKDDKGNGGWRYMPPQLYFYINYCVIEDEKLGTGSVSEISNPSLRDVDWMISYGWLACRRFSGFENDEDYTCHRIVKKIESGVELEPKEKYLLSITKVEEGETEEDRKIPLSIYKKDGTLKKYVDAVEYLYKTHDKNLGLPLYENQALNFFLLGVRGGGKSYTTANAIIGHEYNFNGKIRFNETTQPKTIFVGSAIKEKSAELLDKFELSQEYRAKAFGSWGKNDDFIPGYFYLQHSGTLSSSNNSSYRNEYKYKEGGSWLTTGSGTKILHRTFTTENPQAAVGNRCSVIVVEEVGLCSNLLAVHAANETTMIRRNKFGSAIYIGTGGNMEKITESKIIFEEPDKYNFLPYKNVWENIQGEIGFFLPAYYVDSDFKDPKGNTDIKRAFAQEVYIRKEKEKASNSLALDGWIMARPIVPSEMFLSMSANTFPVALLRAREAFIESRKTFDGIASIGTLKWTKDKQVVWEEDMTTTRLQKPIRHLNLDSYKTSSHGIYGSLVIYEHPAMNLPTPTYSKCLYKITYDPIRDDDGGTSLASIIVYKGYTDSNWNAGIQDGIVAEYIGRPDRVDEVHDMVIKLSFYYNTLVLYENNLPGFKTYCENNKYLDRLMIEPRSVVKQVVSSPSGKRLYGVDMTPPRLHTHAEQLLRQWLLEKWKINDNNKQLHNLDKLNSPRIIRELIAYEPDKKGNFDHVASLKLLALWLANDRENHIFSENENKGRFDNINNWSKSLKRTYLQRASNPWFG